MKIICMGDSTMQYNDASTYPQVGWPQALEKHLKQGVTLLNFAKNGRSTRTFRDLGHFDEAIRAVDEDSIVLIEFGHNDEHTHNPERYTRPDVEYRDNLLFMVGECRKRGAYVLLLTPISRRMFLEDGHIDPACHAGYREAMLKVAEDTGTDAIDMTLLTREELEKTGDEASKEFFMNFDAGIYPNYPDGLHDNTHLRMKGAEMVCGLFLKEIRNNKRFEGLLNDQCD